MELPAHRLLAPVLFASLLAFTTDAGAYVLKRDSTGEVVRWKTRVEFTVDRELSNRLGHPDGLEAVERTFEHLQTAAGVPVSVKAGTVGEAGYNFEDESANRNEISAPESWDFEPNMIAVTLVTINTRTHEIIDADVVFNIVHRRFTVIPDAGETGGDTTRSLSTVDGDDVQNTFTHELGHAVGLAHNPELLEAVMYPGARKGETNKRQLTADDHAGLMELYPSSVVSALSAPVLAPVEAGCSSVGGELGLLCALVLFPLLLARRPAEVPVRARTCTPPRRASHARSLRTGMRVLALAGFASLPRAAQASEVVREPARAAEASVVLTGKVLETRTLTPEKGARVLVSEVVVALDTCLKGTCPARTVTLMVGGKLGDIEQRVEGLEVPERGEAVGLTVLPLEAGKKLPRPTLYRLGEEKDLVAFARGLERANLPFIHPSGMPSGSARPQSQH